MEYELHSKFNTCNILKIFVSSVKSVSRPMASTTTLKYGPKISLSHGTTKGGWDPDPFVVKDYEKGPFFWSPTLIYFNHLYGINKPDNKNIIQTHSNSSKTIVVPMDQYCDITVEVLPTVGNRKCGYISLIHL